MITGIYCGARVNLKGKKALLKNAQYGWYAQFDNKDLEEAIGWHWFPTDCFENIDYGTSHDNS